MLPTSNELTPERIAEIRRNAGLDKTQNLNSQSQTVNTDYDSWLKNLETPIQKPGQMKAVPDEAQEGFFKGLAKSFVKPFAETATAGYNALSATGNLLSGDVEGANKALEAKRDLPFMGETKPGFTGKEGFGEGVKKMAGYGAEMGSNFIGGEGAGSLAKNTLKGLVKQGVKTAVKEGAVSGALNQFGESIKDPNASTTETALSTIAGGVGGGVLGGALSVPSTLIGSGVKKFFTPLEKKAKEAIVEAVGKGIKPSTAGKNTTALQEAYMRDAEEAFHTIAQFKPTLTDEAGNEVVRNPSTRKELLDSIGQVKKRVYNLYDGLKKAAGEAGAQIDTAPIVKELRTAAENPDVKLNKPEIARTLLDRAKMYEEKGALTAQEAQQLVEGINTRLQSFYRNPNYNEASNAAIDALVSGNVRKGLDDVVSNLTGAEYQPLRNKYKALSSIEKDVARQVMVESRKSEKGLIDFTDILTSGDLVKGLLTLNPAEIASGTAGRFLKEVYKKFNDPNRYIDNAFKILSKLPQEPIPQPKQFSPAGLLSEGAIPLAQKSPSTILKELEASGIDHQRLAEIEQILSRQTSDNTLRLPSPDSSKSGPAIQVFPSEAKGIDYVGGKPAVGGYNRPQVYPAIPPQQTNKFYERQSKMQLKNNDKNLQAIPGKNFRKILEGKIVK